METLVQIVEQDTEPDPEGGPGGRRIKKQVAPDRRISIEDKDMRHGRKSSAKTFNGFKEHFVLDLDSRVTREVVVRPANEPEYEAVELVAAALERGQGLRQLDIDLGYMASPRIGAVGRARRVHYCPSLALRRTVFHQARLQLRLCTQDGHLSERPDRADDPRQSRPVSGQCL